MPPASLLHSDGYPHRNSASRQIDHRAVYRKLWELQSIVLHQLQKILRAPTLPTTPLNRTEPNPKRFSDALQFRFNVRLVQFDSFHF